MFEIVYADGTAERQLIQKLKARSGEVDRAVTASVSALIDDVRREGDAAVRRYTEQFDGQAPAKWEVDPAVLDEAVAACDPAFIAALEKAADNIREFHRRQLQTGWSFTTPEGCLLGQRVRGLHRVGIYVPGGTAAYPSTVLMNTIPARIAGVGEIVMVTPPPKAGLNNREILAAARVAGVDRVFTVGGAQAVAALALGTETVPRVDKIVGPGNIYVATAKRLLYGTVDIDMVAGPSEILILADGTADPEYLAADLLSQAEHDRLASAMLITTDRAVAEKTAAELDRQLALLPRREIAAASLQSFGAAIVCRSLEEAVAFANELAPEHLEVMTASPQELLDQLDNVGSVFLGAYSPEPLGDYFAGPNHVLPTSGTARFFSPLSVDSFLKRSSYIQYTADALLAAGPDIVRLAETEGLGAHARSIRVRMEKEGAR